MPALSALAPVVSTCGDGRLRHTGGRSAGSPWDGIDGVGDATEPPPGARVVVVVDAPESAAVDESELAVPPSAVAVVVTPMAPTMPERAAIAPILLAALSRVVVISDSPIGSLAGPATERTDRITFRSV